MDEMFQVLPERMLHVIMHEAGAQAEAFLNVLKASGEKVLEDPDTHIANLPNEDRALIIQFLETIDETDPTVLHNFFVHGFLCGAGYIFRIMSLLDGMSAYLTGDTGYEMDSGGGIFNDEDDDDDDDGDIDRAGMPKGPNDGPVLGKLSDSTIHDLVNSLSNLNVFGNGKKGGKADG